MSSEAPKDQVAPEKGYQIIVNTRPKVVESEYVTYDEIIRLAFDTPPSGPGIVFKIKYHQGPRGSNGSLVPGKDTKVVDGMVFSVTYTDES